MSRWGEPLPLTKKISELDDLLSRVGNYGLKLIDTYKDEDRFRVVDGLRFDTHAVYSDRWFDPDKELPEIERYSNHITVKETGLKVFKDGWIERGPWEQVAEKAIDKSIRKLKRMISAEEKRCEEAKATAINAQKKEHDDLVAKSRALFGGQ